MSRYKYKEYYYLSNKEFRNKVRNCLRTCIKYGYKMVITDYYRNSLHMEGEDIYTGQIIDFKLTHPLPEANWWKLKLEFTNGDKCEFEIQNQIIRTQDIRQVNNSFDILWTTSGPYCSLSFRHVFSIREIFSEKPL